MAAPEIFDASLARARLERAARRGAADADFLLRRAAADFAERLALVKRRFAVAVDIATPGPHGAEALIRDPKIGFAARAAPSAPGPARRAAPSFVGDVERLALAPRSCDLVSSLLALQGVNDLPGTLIQIRQALRPDGLLLACLLGGDTLTELRQSLTAGEAEILAGAAPRVAPFADVRAMGALLQRAGFALPVVDLERVVVRYPDMIALMRDLRAMGATNVLIARSRRFLRRDVLARAGQIYAERFADPDGRLRATFDLIWLSGWAPHESQQQPLKPGSATSRLEDAVKAARKGS
ncbi:MAG TPA: methyltransferase domain-containing protein [Roseiarcus sp.]|nr:methyltransferase domain-containing protein [Roseiarcus sp.]